LGKLSKRKSKGNFNARNASRSQQLDGKLAGFGKPTLLKPIVGLDLLI